MNLRMVTVSAALAACVCSWPGLALAEGSASSGAKKVIYADDGSREADLPGTSYLVGYYETGEAYQLELGDKVEILCLLSPAENAPAVCDSLRLTATLGTGELPIGVDWALLHVKRYRNHWLSSTYGIPGWATLSDTTSQVGPLERNIWPSR